GRRGVQDHLPADGRGHRTVPRRALARRGVGPGVQPGTFPAGRRRDRPDHPAGGVRTPGRHRAAERPAPFHVHHGRRRFRLSALANEIAWVVLPPVAVSCVLFALLLPSLARRQAAVLAAGERVSAQVGAAFEGHRDIVAFGRAEHVIADVSAVMVAERTIQQRMARALAARSVVTALGSHLPLLALLFATPWLLDRGASVGTIIGAATYLSMHLDPAVKTLTEMVGGSGLQLSVTLGRLSEVIAAAPP